MPSITNAANEHTLGKTRPTMTMSSSSSTSSQVARTRCPHVVLIGADFNWNLLVAATGSAADAAPKCQDCGLRKHLWACLRADCGYVGCGGSGAAAASTTTTTSESSGRQHSSQHAVRMHHPLAVNLNTRAVWCELCECRVVLESNDPRPPLLSLLTSPLASTSESTTHKMLTAAAAATTTTTITPTAMMRDPSIDECMQTADALASTVDLACDDFDLINYLDQENERDMLNMDSSGSGDQAVVECRNGQLGLDNLGNTCYMNAALQCLSNIYALTSLFLECSQYIKATSMRRLNQQQQHQQQQQQQPQSLSMTYMRLMRDMWQRPAKIFSKKNAENGGGGGGELVTSLAPVDLIRVIKIAQPMFRGCQQHDSMEFLTFLLDQMHEELKRPSLTVQSQSQLRLSKQRKHRIHQTVKSSSNRLGHHTLNGQMDAWKNENGDEENNEYADNISRNTDDVVVDDDEEEAVSEDETEDNENDDEEYNDLNGENNEYDDDEDNVTIVKRHRHHHHHHHNHNHMHHQDEIMMQQQPKSSSSNGNSDLDSGISSVTTNSLSSSSATPATGDGATTTTISSSASTYSHHGNGNGSGSEDAQSIDSYVTCGDGADSTTMSSSSLSLSSHTFPSPSAVTSTSAAAAVTATASSDDFSLHYSDADESLSSSSSPAPPPPPSNTPSSVVSSHHHQHNPSVDSSSSSSSSAATSSSSSSSLRSAFNDVNNLMQNKKQKPETVNTNNSSMTSTKKRRQEGTTSPKVENNHQLQKKQPKQQHQQTRTTYTSIVSELFEGALISQVQCLECEHVSTTTESFWHLSLPIPSKEHMNTLHTRLVARQQQQQQQQQQQKQNGTSNNSNDYSSSSSSSLSQQQQQQQQQGWLSWLVDTMKGFVWSQTIKLTDCLTAFFSDDDLKDDNMYSCDKCKKLTNGIKYSKILNLPEVLIVHLKRFRHDSMFSAGKISSYISFPIDNLNMQPFVHKDCKNEITQYDLCSVICHYGSANGGHYTAFGRNHFNEEWYEYDDSFCRQVDSLTIQNTQAYVLFYKKKNIKTDTVKDELRSIFAQKASASASSSSSLSSASSSLGRSGVNSSLLASPHYISKLWLHKLKHFGEPGPIDQSALLCAHNLVRAHDWRNVDALALSCSPDAWSYLCEMYAMRAPHAAHQPCTRLYPCAACQRDEERVRQRQWREKIEFIRLREKWNHEQLQAFAAISQYQQSPQPPPPQQRVFAISAAWFKQWEQFVQQQPPQPVDVVPGKIDNMSICVKPQAPPQQPTQQQQYKAKKKQQQNQNQNTVFHLNTKSKFYKISEEMWSFLHDIYGGGPALEIPTTSTTAVTTTSTATAAAAAAGATTTTTVAAMAARVAKTSTSSSSSLSTSTRGESDRTSARRDSAHNQDDEEEEEDGDN